MTNPRAPRRVQVERESPKANRRPYVVQWECPLCWAMFGKKDECRAHIKRKHPR